MLKMQYTFEGFDASEVSGKQHDRAHSESRGADRSKRLPRNQWPPILFRPPWLDNGQIVQKREGSRLTEWYGAGNSTRILAVLVPRRLLAGADVRDKERVRAQRLNFEDLSRR